MGRRGQDSSNSNPIFQHPKTEHEHHDRDILERHFFHGNVGPRPHHPQYDVKHVKNGRGKGNGR